MKKTSRLAWTLSLVGVVALTGCRIDNQLDFVISQFDGLATGMCVADPGATTTLNAGLLDVGVSAAGYGGYYAAPVVSNNLFVTATSSTVETNSIQLNGVEVTLKPVKGTVLDAAIASNQRKYFVPAAGGVIQPMAKAGIVVEIIPTQLAIQLAQTIQAGAIPERLVVHVEPVGKRAGQNINGGGADFPVSICKFCLTTSPPPPCPTGGFMSQDVIAGSCFPEQDAKVTCCVSGAAGTVCGADVPVAKTN